MARVYPLFSSSKGNATFFGTNKAGILIDVGITYKRLTEAMKLCELDISAIKGVFITHDHTDHVKGLKVLTKNLGVPVYGQGKTLRNLIDSDMIHPKSAIAEVNSAISVADMEISAFDTPHDSVQSCGYRMKMSDGKLCALCTDLGHITRTVDENLMNCDLVIIEANYDETMLKDGPYPPYVKNRIRSDNGHLSNVNCSAQVAKLIRTGTTRIVLGHISQENNTPYLADYTVQHALSEFKRNKDYILQVAPVETIGKMVTF